MEHLSRQPSDTDKLTDRELLELAAQGQDILSEGTLVHPLVYRILAQRGLTEAGLDNPCIIPGED